MSEESPEMHPTRERRARAAMEAAKTKQPGETHQIKLRVLLTIELPVDVDVLVSLFNALTKNFPDAVVTSEPGKLLIHVDPEQVGGWQPESRE